MSSIPSNEEDFLLWLATPAGQAKLEEFRRITGGNTNTLPLRDSERAAKNPTGFIVDVLVNERRDVLVVDENKTFSTTLALAAMRGGSFAGMSSAHHLKENIIFTERLSENVTASYDRRDLYSGHLHEVGLYEHARNIPAWRNALEAELFRLEGSELDPLDYDFTAENIGNIGIPQLGKHLIWMNFPWTPRAGYLHHYLKNFLRGCSSHQESGGIILLTVTRNERWEEYYDLEGLLALARGLGYHCFKEHNFVNGIFDYFGYRHKTWNDAYNIHYHVVPCSDTHILVKD